MLPEIHSRWAVLRIPAQFVLNLWCRSVLDMLPEVVRLVDDDDIGFALLPGAMFPLT
jgi:hypothetical protein